MRILITEFMDERAVARLQAAHDVHCDPQLVDDALRLATEAARADVVIVRNRTQVRGALLAALARCWRRWRAARWWAGWVSGWTTSTCRPVRRVACG